MREIQEQAYLCSSLAKAARERKCLNGLCLEVPSLRERKEKTRSERQVTGKSPDKLDGIPANRSDFDG
jgi:hypothetical protein